MQWVPVETGVRFLVYKADSSSIMHTHTHTRTPQTLLQSPCWDQRSLIWHMVCDNVLLSHTNMTQVRLYDRHVLAWADDIQWLLHCTDSLKSDAIVVHFTPKILQNWLPGLGLTLYNNTVWLFGPDIPNRLHCNLIWSHRRLWLTCKRIRPLMDCCNNSDSGQQSHCCQHFL